MRAARILLAFCALLVALAAENASVVAQADESGECVTNSEGQCINPDAVEEPVVEQAVPEDPPQEEAVTEAIEEVVEEVVESQPDEAEHVEAVTDEAIPEETTEEQVQETPVEEEVTEAVQEEPVEEAVEEAPVPEEPVKEEVPEETATATDAEEPVLEDKAEEETPGCPSRKHVIKCAAQYLDTNQNNYLEREELQAAMDKLPWFSRGILSILGSVDKMMTKCDIDGDGAIGIEYDMRHNSETCLATCFKRRAFKAAFFPECTV